MVVVKKKSSKESDEKLIARFKKDTLDIIMEARDRQRFKSKAEKRKEKRQKIKHLQEIERKRNKRYR